VRENLQPEAKALASPTRNRIFRYVAEAAHPVGVAELTSFMGFNHNAIRQHLAVLVEAGLVNEGVAEDRGRGRPRLLYRLNPEAAGRWETVGPYEYLAGLFATALESGQSPGEAGRAAGRQIAATLEADVDPLDAIEDQMQRRGFRPERIAKGSKVDFVLGRCPFEEVAASNPDAVCQLHRGLAEGLAEGLGGVQVDRLVVKNPHRAGCRVALRRAPARAAAAR
jgi:predicted ArsR family transcriptional regulator